MNTLLRFPGAPSVDLDFGNAMHETLQWLQLELNKHGALPTREQANDYLVKRLELKSLTTEQIALQQARGENAVEAYLTGGAPFTAGNLPEYNFRNEGVVLADNIRMSGKIDLLEIDKERKVIRVIDYKTGSLGSDPAKRHRYELQLYCYKILLQGSHTFRDYKVEQGSLIFVEPDADGKIQRHSITFKDDELERVRQLVMAMWHRVTTLDLPDTSAYGTTFADMKRFEQDLLETDIK